MAGGAGSDAVAFGGADPLEVSRRTSRAQRLKNRAERFSTDAGVVVGLLVFVVAAKR